MDITITLTQEQVTALIESGIVDIQQSLTDTVHASTRIPVEEYRKRRSDEILKTYNENPQIADVVTQFSTATKEDKDSILSILKLDTKK